MVNLKLQTNSFELFDASGAGEKDRVEEIINLGHIDINARVGPTQTTALHVASKNNKPDTIEILANNHADINAVNKEYDTPVHEAAKGSLQALLVLLSFGCCLEMRNNISFTPIFTACEYGCVQIVKELINKGAKIFKVEAVGRTLLHVATKCEIIKLLVDKGLDIDARDQEGNTPLHEAAKFFKKKRIVTLLELGANPTIPNTKGETPYDLVVTQTWRGKKDPIMILREAQQNWTGKDKHKRPAVVVDEKQDNGSKMKEVAIGVDGFTEQAAPRPKPGSVSRQEHTTDNTLLKHVESCELGSKVTDKNTEEGKLFTEEVKQENLSLRFIRDTVLVLMSLVMTDDDANVLPVDTHKQMHLDSDYNGNRPLKYLKMLRHLKQKLEGTTSCVLKRLHRKIMNKKMLSVNGPVISGEHRRRLEGKTVTRQILMTLSRPLAKHYFHFGMLIGLSYETMTEIEYNDRNDSRERCFQTVRAWRQQFPEATCVSAVEAMVVLGIPCETTIKDILECDCIVS